MKQINYILALKDNDLSVKLNGPCKRQLVFILCLMILKIDFAYRILIARLWYVFKILCIDGNDECNYDNDLSNDNDNTISSLLKFLVQLSRGKNMKKLSKTFLCP